MQEGNCIVHSIRHLPDHFPLEQEKGINLNCVISDLDSGFGIEGNSLEFGKEKCMQHRINQKMPTNRSGICFACNYMRNGVSGKDHI